MASWQEPARLTDSDGKEFLMKGCNRQAFICRPKIDIWQDTAHRILWQLRATEVFVQIQAPTIL
jgi:hypothetical protein